MNLEWSIGNDRGQPIRVTQLPMIDKAVVTRGALHIDAEEHLRHILRELHLAHLAGIHAAAPLDAIDEAFRFRRWP
jgi:hypothetical protein